MIQKGADLADLFDSKIFNHTFDYDEWPATHHNTSKLLHPYNESYFKLRYKYPNVYKKLFDRDNRMSDEKKERMKPYKIAYQLNILPSMSEADGQLMEALANSEELPMFQTDLVQDLIEYKW